MNYTKDQLFEKFQDLPDDIRQSFLSIDTMRILDRIRDEHRLHVDQAGILSEQVGLFLLGITRPSELLTNIEQRLGVPIETAGAIVKEINEKIFFPIRTSLKALHHPEEQGKYEPEAAPKVENFSPAGQVTAASIPKQEPGPLTPGNNAVIINEQPAGGPEKADVETSAEAGNKNIFDEKMSKLFRLPKEQVEIKSGKVTTPPASGKPTAPADPYHESVE